LVENLFSVKSEDEEIHEIIDSWKELPRLFLDIIKQAFLYIVYITFFIGALLLIIGVLEWMSGWNEIAGKKNIIRGVILIIVSTAPMIV